MLSAVGITTHLRAQDPWENDSSSLNLFALVYLRGNMNAGGVRAAEDSNQFL